jgi:hypothetical protein
MSAERSYAIDTMVFMARTHQKVIDYYNYVLEELRPSDEERSRIVAVIRREAGLGGEPDGSTNCSTLVSP